VSCKKKSYHHYFSALAVTFWRRQWRCGCVRSLVPMSIMIWWLRKQKGQTFTAKSSHVPSEIKVPNAPLLEEDRERATSKVYRIIKKHWNVHSFYRFCLHATYIQCTYIIFICFEYLCFRDPTPAFLYSFKNAGGVPNSVISDPLRSVPQSKVSVSVLLPFVIPGSTEEYF
jgi:hypothetical protein